MMTVSIVIPTLNEAQTVSRLLQVLHEHCGDAEIIVADGGSTDGTVDAAQGMATIVHAECGRALQMNAGARAATGDVLWFLHADSIVPVRSIQPITEALTDAGVVGGGFRWGLTGGHWYYRPITAVAHVKNRLRGNLFGDMGIFVRKEVFSALKGFAPIPLMEDVEFNRRLKKMGKTVLLDETLYSSDRRLREQGPFRAFIKNAVIKCAYRLGVPPDVLCRYY